MLLGTPLIQVAGSFHQLKGLLGSALLLYQFSTKTQYIGSVPVAGKHDGMIVCCEPLVTAPILN